MYLLEATRFVEIDFLDQQWIIKIGCRWIVEGDMAVFPDAETDDIDRSHIHEKCVSPHFVADRQTSHIQKMRCFYGNVIEERPSQET